MKPERVQGLNNKNSSDMMHYYNSMCPLSIKCSVSTLGHLSQRLIPRQTKKLFSFAARFVWQSTSLAQFEIGWQASWQVARGCLSAVGKTFNSRD